MAELIGTTAWTDLTPVAAEAGVVEGDPRLVYTWGGPTSGWLRIIRSYTPSADGAPRLVAAVSGRVLYMGVWDTDTGTLLRDLQVPAPDFRITSLVTYQRSSDGRPRNAAGSERHHLCVWDGDDLRVLPPMHGNTKRHYVMKLAVFEEPISGSTRLVTG
jgi:hypothetical protein